LIYSANINIIYIYIHPYLHISSHFPPHFAAQTQLGHLRDAYGKTLKILGAAPTGAAGSEAAGALLEPLAPEVGTSMP
jgi:hypothetical protein